MFFFPPNASVQCPSRFVQIHLRYGLLLIKGTLTSKTLAAPGAVSQDSPCFLSPQGPPLSSTGLRENKMQPSLAILDDSPLYLWTIKMWTALVTIWLCSTDLPFIVKAHSDPLSCSLRSRFTLINPPTEVFCLFICQLSFLLFIKRNQFLFSKNKNSTFSHVISFIFAIRNSQVFSFFAGLVTAFILKFGRGIGY